MAKISGTWEWQRAPWVSCGMSEYVQFISGGREFAKIVMVVTDGKYPVTTLYYYTSAGEEVLVSKANGIGSGTIDPQYSRMEFGSLSQNISKELYADISLHATDISTATVWAMRIVENEYTLREREVRYGNRLTVPDSDELFEYEETTEGITITGVTKTYRDLLVIPYVLNDNFVTSVAFKSPPLCKKVILPNTITTIGAGAFQSDTVLQEIVMQEGVKTIGQNAFLVCTSLTDIVLPSTIETIESGAFCGVPMNELELPASLTSIGNDAFSGCTQLKRIEIPDSVTSIGSYAFYNTGLEEVKLSANLTSLGSGAFQGYSGRNTIKKVIVPGRNTPISGKFDNQPNLVVYCKSGSLAESYAENAVIPYKILNDSDNMDIPMGVRGFKIKKYVLSGDTKYIIHPNSIIVALPGSKCLQLYAKNGSLISNDTYGKMTLYVSDNYDICYAGTTSSMLSIPEMYLAHAVGAGCYIKTTDNSEFVVMATEYNAE